MGEPAAVFKVNGTKLQSQAPVPRPCEGISVEQFWSERLQALKRHLESTQTSSDTRPTGGELDAEDGRWCLSASSARAVRAGRCRRPLGAIDG
jgi:hypothetical protein